MAAVRCPEEGDDLRAEARDVQGGPGTAEFCDHPVELVELRRAWEGAARYDRAFPRQAPDPDDRRSACGSASNAVRTSPEISGAFWTV